MSDIGGFYYLHTEGALLYKRWDAGREVDLIESPFVRCYWPFNPGNRADAWHIIIEGTVAGVNPDRIRVLAELWGCTEEDADKFAEYIGLVFMMKEGDRLKVWKIGSGGASFTKVGALVSLCRNIGWKCSKDRVSFEDLVKGRK